MKRYVLVEIEVSEEDEAAGVSAQSLLQGILDGVGNLVPIITRHHKPKVTMEVDRAKSQLHHAKGKDA